VGCWVIEGSWLGASGRCLTCLYTQLRVLVDVFKQTDQVMVHVLKAAVARLHVFASNVLIMSWPLNGDGELDCSEVQLRRSITC
jgi:hypothetical protein